MKRAIGLALFAAAAMPLVLGADMAAAFVNEWLAALAWVAAFGVLGSLLALGAASEHKTTAFFTVGLALTPIAIMAREQTPVIAVAIVALASALAADVWAAFRA